MRLSFLLIKKTENVRINLIFQSNFVKNFYTSQPPFTHQNEHLMTKNNSWLISISVYIVSLWGFLVSPPVVSIPWETGNACCVLSIYSVNTYRVDLTLCSTLKWDSHFVYVSVWRIEVTWLRYQHYPLLAHSSHTLLTIIVLLPSFSPMRILNVWYIENTKYVWLQQCQYCSKEKVVKDFHS